MSAASRESLRVLGVDGGSDTADPMGSAFERLDDRFSVTWVTEARAAVDRLDGETFDCLVSAHADGRIDGLELLRSVRAEYPHLPFVLVPREGDEWLASQAIARGVSEYVPTIEDGKRAKALVARVERAAAEPVGGTIGDVQDNSQRTQRQTERAASRDRYQRLVEAAPVAIAIYGQEGDILYANDATVDLVNYPDAESLRGESAFEFVHESDRALASERMGEVIDDRETAPPAEMTLVDRNGNHKEVIIASVPITHEGEPAAQIVIKDVTELKEREYELQRQRDQLDEFASIVSHDLRNPLEVLRGRLDLAREECDSEHLDAAMETQERMATLVDDLLRFARVGERAVEEEPLDLETVATAAWQNVATPDATLTIESTPTLEGDPNRVAELLENLFSNAIEHGGDDVTVTVGRLDGGFFVGDDGTVIPPAERADVFEYGYSSSDEGTGIGLAVVKQIAGAHDWTIDVCESSAGGTRFEFRTADPGE